jgi:uncharacterized protein YkwD
MNRIRSNSCAQRALTLLAACAVAACGGGGAGGTAPVAAPSAPTTTAPATDSQALQLQAPDLTSLSQSAVAAISHLNEARVRYGQGYLYPNAALQKAAQDHSVWVANAESIPEGAHYQVPNTPFFTGHSPSDRVRNAGYLGANSEILSAITEGTTFKSQQEADAAKLSGTGLMSPQELGKEFSKSQLNSVYHRFAALGPWRDAGFGASYYKKAAITSLGNHTVSSTVGLSLGCQSQCQYPKALSLMVYPTPGSIADGLRFANEVPHPAPDLGLGAVFGFPVTVEASSDISSIDIFELRGPNGQVIRARTHTSKTDPAQTLKPNQAFLLPLESLEPNTTYTVTIELKIAGLTEKKIWQFVTPANN